MKPFTYFLRVRYVECDAQRVVFNSRYAEYVDLAATELVRAAGLAAVLIDGRYDYQLVKQTIEWKAPARFDQVLALSVHPVHFGNTSFSLRTEFRIAGEDPVIATAETVYVLVEAQTLRKTPLPDDLRAALQGGAAGQTVDHAACRGDRHGMLEGSRPGTLT
jgi:acyl-CoA thioester hydrolase